MLVLSVYCLAPRLLTWAVSAYVSLDVAFLVPLALLFCASLVAYGMAGHAWTWAKFKDRFRLRGYILPRQELAYGRQTWVVHGLLWTLFHAFKYWEFAALLPACLAFSFVAQRRKNTWPGIVTHFALNGSESMSVLLLVMGVL